MQLNDCRLDHQYSLTLGFHHDRGLVVFADSPRRGEYRALGRRLRRGNEERNIRPSALNTKINKQYEQ